MRPITIIAVLWASLCGLAPASALALTPAPNTAYASDNPAASGLTTPPTMAVPIAVTAHVGTMCQVISGGAGAGAGAFGDTVLLDAGAPGSIVNPDGRIRTDLNASTAASASVTQSYQINCTGTNNQISLQATPLVTGTGSAPTGYSATVNYTAEVDFSVVGGTSPVKLSHNSDSSLNTGNLGTGVSLANNANDIVIKAYGFDAATHGAVLTAGAYSGAITVIIKAGT